MLRGHGAGTPSHASDVPCLREVVCRSTKDGVRQSARAVGFAE
jgi:hypothetical protein